MLMILFKVSAKIYEGGGKTNFDPNVFFFYLVSLCPQRPTERT